MGFTESYSLLTGKQPSEIVALIRENMRLKPQKVFSKPPHDTDCFRAELPSVGFPYSVQIAPVIDGKMTCTEYGTRVDIHIHMHWLTITYFIFWAFIIICLLFADTGLNDPLSKILIVLVMLIIGPVIVLIRYRLMMKKSKKKLAELLGPIS